MLVRPDHTQAAGGYNGAPRGAKGCLSDGACPRGRYSHAELPAGSSYEAAECIALHAEMNCLADMRESAEGCTLYISEKPCYMCKTVIKANRIARVVWPDAEAQSGRDYWVV